LPRSGLLPRTEHVRDARLFVIATEGRYTEKQYLEGLFGSPRLKVKALDAGEAGLSSPEQTLDRLSLFNEQYALTQDDERWLMIDVDRWPLNNLREACHDAKQRGFQIAVSNPCFELWLRLHFVDADPADTNCRKLKKRLKVELGSYNWSNLDLSHYTLERIQAAIQRARALSQNSAQPWPDSPGTHVYQIVERLLPHLRPRPIKP